MNSGCSASTCRTGWWPSLSWLLSPQSSRATCRRSRRSFDADQNPAAAVTLVFVGSPARRAGGHDRTELAPRHLSEVTVLAAFLYRCPNTGRNVQGYVADPQQDEGSEDDFQSIACNARSALHWVNPKIGKGLGTDDE